MTGVAYFKTEHVKKRVTAVTIVMGKKRGDEKTGVFAARKLIAHPHHIKRPQVAYTSLRISPFSLPHSCIR